MELVRTRLWPLAFILAASCSTAAPQVEPGSRVRTGAEVLADRGFDLLLGKRVGLITNHTAMVDSVHLIDLLADEERVELAALFGPEHGLRGSTQGGDHIADAIDDRTGVPVYSLYGERRGPPDSVLASLDVLIFDIQDIGARFYTYISTMGRSMQAAAAAGVPFWVFDRPNPIGRRAEGFVLDSANYSFVGLYPIPVTHGLTVGELALMIQGEAMLPGLEELELFVVPVSGWDPDSLWPVFGTEWIKTSPNIPDFETALLYPGVGLFEGTSWNEGRGTTEPFKHVGTPVIEGDDLVESLNARGLPGVRFERDTFVPVSIPSMSVSPKFQDVQLQGVRLVITDPAVYAPVATGVHLVSAAYRHSPDSVRTDFFKSRWMRLISGGSQIESMLTEGIDPDDIIAAWQDEVAAFVERRTRYLLY